MSQKDGTNSGIQPLPLPLPLWTPVNCRNAQNLRESSALSGIGSLPGKARYPWLHMISLYSHIFRSTPDIKNFLQIRLFLPPSIQCQNPLLSVPDPKMPEALPCSLQSVRRFSSMWKAAG